MLDLILQSLALKDEQRNGWLLRRVSRPESVADHCWGTALLCLLFAEKAGVNACRAVSMAIVHDLAEAVTGDVPTRVAAMDDPEVIEAKRRRERDGMKALLSDAGAHPESQVRELWEEYEENETETAHFVRDMNLIDMCAQAHRYEESGRYDPSAPNENFPDFAGLDEFFATTRPRLTGAVGRELFDELRERYAAIPSVRERGGPRLEPSEK